MKRTVSVNKFYINWLHLQSLNILESFHSYANKYSIETYST